MPRCEICSGELKHIQWSHLKSHGITIDEYKKQFPKAELVSMERKREQAEIVRGEKNPAKCPEVGEKISKTLKGRKRSEKHKLNLSIALKGHIPWNIGLTKETDNRIRKGFKPWNKGKSNSLETRLKISNALKGREISEKARRKLSELHSGKKNPFYGKKHSRETLIRISLALGGKNNPRWKGGCTDYRGPNWREQRERARKRDNYTCQICGEKENGRELDVHHMISFREFGLDNYEEANQLLNIITLCHSCHGKSDAGEIPVDTLKGIHIPWKERERLVGVLSYLKG